MAVITKLTVVALLLCFLCLFGESMAKENVWGRKSAGIYQGRIVKREADQEDYADDGSFGRPEFNRFERPHKIHVVPGFLH